MEPSDDINPHYTIPFAGGVAIVSRKDLAEVAHGARAVTDLDNYSNVLPHLIADWMRMVEQKT